MHDSRIYYVTEVTKAFHIWMCFNYSYLFKYLSQYSNNSISNVSIFQYTLLCYNLLSSFVIWCHMMSSGVSWCHILSSNVLCCHLMSSVVIWCHMMSSDVNSCHHWISSEVIWCHVMWCVMSYYFETFW